VQLLTERRFSDFHNVTTPLPMAVYDFIALSNVTPSLFYNGDRPITRNVTHLSACYLLPQRPSNWAHTILTNRDRNILSKVTDVLNGTDNSGSS
jgi:hypothetical protein